MVKLTEKNFVGSQRRWTMSELSYRAAQFFYYKKSYSIHSLSQMLFRDKYQVALRHGKMLILRSQHQNFLRHI